MIFLLLSCASPVCEYEETKQSVAETEERLDALIKRLEEVHPEEAQEVQEALASAKDTDELKDSAGKKRLQ